MKTSVSLGVVLSAVVCLAYGCSADDDDAQSSPHAGAAGKGGGSGGKGGTAAGKSGTTANGGKAATGGSSGHAGRGGGGFGGDSGGGGASDGGRCAEEQPVAPLAECPANPNPFGDQGTVQTTCSFEDTCRALDCGGTWSQFEESGCRRPTCDASSDCGSSERCASPLLVGNWDCYPSLFEGCEVRGCSCSCSATEDCSHPAFCQPSSDFPEPLDCSVSTLSCFDLVDFITAMESWTNGLDGGSLTDVDKALVACTKKAQHELDRCQGFGGEGGGGAGGQSGANAGGASGSGHSGGGQAGG